MALVRENIGAVWCDDPPRPEWCQWLRRVGDEPVVKVDGTKLTIGVRAAIPGALAEALCRDVAIALFDDNGIPIGFVRVDVESGPESFVTNCFVG